MTLKIFYDTANFARGVRETTTVFSQSPLSSSGERVDDRASWFWTGVSKKIPLGKQIALHYNLLIYKQNCNPNKQTRKKKKRTQLLAGAGVRRPKLPEIKRLIPNKKEATRVVS